MKVIPVGDVHAPYCDKKAMKALLAHIKKEKPHVVVQMGDLLDQYVFSSYARNSSITPEYDVKEGLKVAKQFWKDVKKVAPKAKCYKLLGNHDLRLAKRIAEKLPELQQAYNPIKTFYTFPGVTTLKSDRDYLTIDGVNYCHGWFSSSLKHAEHYNRPTVHGHLHRAGLSSKGRLWSMDVGYLADENTIPLQYGQSSVSNWARGLAIVVDGKPNIKL